MYTKVGLFPLAPRWGDPVDMSVGTPRWYFPAQRESNKRGVKSKESIPISQIYYEALLIILGVHRFAHVWRNSPLLGPLVAMPCLSVGINRLTRGQS